MIQQDAHVSNAQREPKAADTKRIKNGNHWTIPFEDESPTAQRRRKKIFDWLCAEARRSRPRLRVQQAWADGLRDPLNRIRLGKPCAARPALSLGSLLCDVLADGTDIRTGRVLKLGLVYLRMVGAAVQHGENFDGQSMPIAYAIGYIASELESENIIQFRRGPEFASVVTTPSGVARFGRSFAAELVRIAGSEPLGPKGFSELEFERSTSRE